MSSRDMMIEDACDDICQQYQNQYPLDYRQIAFELFEAVRSRIRVENAILEKKEQFSFPSRLDPYMVAKLIRGLHPVALINRTTISQDDRDSRDGLYLAAYEEDRASPRYGLYSARKIEELARAYSPALTDKEQKEVKNHLRFLCRDNIRDLTQDDNLVAVKNGIFNIKTQQLMDFSSDFVFLVKARIDYVPTATVSPVIQCSDGTSWDPLSWLCEIANHEDELVNLFWEIIAATVRTTHSFDKIVYFYSPQGANGKSTFAELLKSLMPFANINLSRLSAQFGLSELDSPVGLIISDENAVDQELKNLTNIKALASHDTVSIERKFEHPYQMNFTGLVVQTVNSIPSVSDVSNSFLRRLMIVPFKQNYEGKENRQIKADYVHRKEVLEFVLNQALKLDFDAFHVPAQCEIMKEEFMDMNNDVYSFFKDVNEQLRWNLVPNDFLFQLYSGWMDKNMPGKRKRGKNKFLEELRNILGQFENWEIVPNGRPTNGFRFGFEPLIEEYNLYRTWGDETKIKDDRIRACTPHKMPTSVGGIRKVVQHNSTVNPNPFAQAQGDVKEETPDDSVDGESLGN